MHELLVAEIVAHDRTISDVLACSSGNRAHLMFTAWRLTQQPEAFVAALVARLLLEHDKNTQHAKASQ